MNPFKKHNCERDGHRYGKWHAGITYQWRYCKACGWKVYARVPDL